jgi:ABC-2 type transport system permease protein
VKKILAVARWEYVEKVKSKAFVVGLLVTPLLLIGMAVLPGLFASREITETTSIGVIDGTGELAEPFAKRLQEKYRLPGGEPAYVVMQLASGRDVHVEDVLARARREVAEGILTGYLLIGGGTAGDSIQEYRTVAVGDLRTPARIEETLSAVATEVRGRSLGFAPAVLDRIRVRYDVRLVKLSREGEREEAGFEAVFLTAYGFLMMLFFLIATSGQMLVRSVIEEKSNRIVELLVSSCSSTELMAGKVLGLSAMGLTQMAVWVLIGIAVAAWAGVEIVTPGRAALLALYFILGYLLYAGVFIGAGSPLTTEQEAQQVTSYLVILLIVPVALAFPVLQNPDSGWVRFLTFVPFLTPTMMALRIPLQMPPWWEIGLTTLVLTGTIWLVMIAAGRIFRIGILSTGKTPTLKEVLRWARTA